MLPHFLVPIILSAVVSNKPVDTEAITPELLEAFAPAEYLYTGGQYENEPFRYRLFSPPHASSAQEYPLIVWLHGAGAIELKGQKNIGQLKHLLLIIDEPAKPERYPFYVLAMQMKVNHWYSKHASFPDKGSDEAEEVEQLTVLKEIIDQLVATEPIDRDRIYLSGLSAGGSGCWEMAFRYPDLFAAVAPLASGGVNITEVDRLADLPIWAFQSSRDPGISPDSTRNLVAAFKEAQGNVHLTEIDKAAHDCWVEAFQQYRLLDWLLNQQRGATDRWPAGYVPWNARQWGEYLLPNAAMLLLVGCILVSIVKELRRRKPAASVEGDATDEVP